MKYTEEKILASKWFEDQDTGSLYVFDGNKWHGDNEIVSDLLSEFEADQNSEHAIRLIETEIGVDLRAYHDSMKNIDLLQDILKPNPHNH